MDEFIEWYCSELRLSIQTTERYLGCKQRTEHPRLSIAFGPDCGTPRAITSRSMLLFLVKSGGDLVFHSPSENMWLNYYAL